MESTRLGYSTHLPRGQNFVLQCKCGNVSNYKEKYEKIIREIISYCYTVWKSTIKRDHSQKIS